MISWVSTLQIPTFEGFPRVGHRPRLWRTPKTNLANSRGRCHSEKCRAWWAESFLIFRGNCSWFYGIKFSLCIFFSTNIQPKPHKHTHADTQTWLSNFGNKTMVYRDLNSANCSAHRALHVSIWRRPLKTLRFVYTFHQSRELERVYVANEYIKKRSRWESLGFWQAH